MDSYRIEWKSSAEKELKAIDRQHIPRILEAVESLTINPFPSQSRKLRDVEKSYRIRVGDYRIVYQVDEKEGMVTIYHIRHRKDIYRQL
jgi:mRNA interferase RelE/StbE